MMNLIQLLTDHRAYEGITHSRWEHHGIGDVEGLEMTKNEDPPLRNPNGVQIWPPDEQKEVTAAPSHGMR